MKMIIIGSGNVAYHLAKAYTQNGIQVSQIYGRNELELRKISKEFKIPYSTHVLEQADFYLICVSDSSVAQVSKLIREEKALVAHTSGSLPKEILEGNYRKSSFYPLQTFSKSKDLEYGEIPFFIEAENKQDIFFLNNLATKISTKVMEIDYEKRKYIHLTAVFACNFVNHLYARAKEIADSQQIPFHYFLPLIDETTAKIHEIDPKLAQTGPAIRNDQKILETHEKLISDPELLKIYKTMNESIERMYRGNRPEIK